MFEVLLFTLLRQPIGAHLSPASSEQFAWLPASPHALIQ